MMVLDGEKGLAEALARRWLEISCREIERKGFFAAALSGGRTPVPYYRHLAHRRERDLWEKTHLFLVDERFVLVNDPQRNYRMIREALVDRISIPRQNVHSIPVEGMTPVQAAEKYEEEVRVFFRIRPGEFPVFDLILLGIGEDGHTASLFPGHPVLEETFHLAAAVWPDEAKVPRITLTLPAINRGRNIFFLVTGREKAAVLQEIIEKKNARYPAARVKPQGGSLQFFIDREAGALLSLP